MNLKQLKYVLTLANSGSFSIAAETLGISQPSLSQYIKNIEKQLGITLFDRLNGNVRLTDAGMVYIDAGRKILDLERQMQNRLTDILESRAGSVIIGTSPFRSASMMPKVAAAFQKKYEGMHLVIREMGTQELLEKAEHGEFDLCVTMLPVSEKLFSYELIMEEELVLAVKKGSALDEILASQAYSFENRSHKAVDVSLLQGEKFVMLTENQMMQKALDDLCYSYALDLRTAVVVKSLEAQIEMVSEGVGAALVPIGVQSFCRLNQNVSYYSFLQELPRRQLAVIYPKEKYLSEPMRALIDMMKQ